MFRKLKARYIVLLGLVFVIMFGFLIPQTISIPVVGATKSDWNKDSFWYEPWGTSGVHKGVDIFSSKGVPVVAPINMLVLYKGNIKKGGVVIVGLDSRWRLYYFAHLEKIEEKLGFFVLSGSRIGTVGDSGNAKGKPPHLHFSIISLVPLPWLIDGSTQGYKKAFYIDPIKFMNSTNS